MRVQENEFLGEWEKVCEKPVIGMVGSRLRFEGGPAHPMGHAPLWVTSRGVDVALLHAAHCAAMCHDHREEFDDVPVVKSVRKRKFWLVARRVVA